MAKRKKSNVGMILSGLSVLLGLAAIIMLFLPAVAVKDTDTTYTGLQVTFGYSVDIPIWGEAVVFKFSFMNLLAYILAAAGVVFAILSAMGKSGKFASFIAAAAFIAAGVLFVIQPSFIIRDGHTPNGCCPRGNPRCGAFMEATGCWNWVITISSRRSMTTRGRCGRER